MALAPLATRVAIALPPAMTVKLPPHEIRLADCRSRLRDTVTLVPLPIVVRAASTPPRR